MVMLVTYSINHSMMTLDFFYLFLNKLNWYIEFHFILSDRTKKRRFNEEFEQSIIGDTLFKDSEILLRDTLWAILFFLRHAASPGPHCNTVIVTANSWLQQCEDFCPWASREDSIARRLPFDLEWLEWIRVSLDHEKTSTVFTIWPRITVSP